MKRVAELCIEEARAVGFTPVALHTTSWSRTAPPEIGYHLLIYVHGFDGVYDSFWALEKDDRKQIRENLRDLMEMYDLPTAKIEGGE